LVTWLVGELVIGAIAELMADLQADAITKLPDYQLTKSALVLFSHPDRLIFTNPRHPEIQPLASFSGIY
jgi:hypothetical protein